MGKKNKPKDGGKSIELGAGKGKTLEVEIAGTGKTYHIPLADSLSIGDAMEIRRVQNLPKKKRDEGFFNAFYNIACRYVPKKYVDMLSMDDFGTLLEAWNDASEEAGAGPGE